MTLQIILLVLSIQLVLIAILFYIDTLIRTSYPKWFNYNPYDNKTFRYAVLYNSKLRAWNASFEFRILPFPACIFTLLYIISGIIVLYTNKDNL